MGASPDVVRVRREALSARMTCPLCQGLLREATAITECLHTFCRECIMKEINDEDVDCCPVCNIDLGCDPEEKLRPDHNLQDIRNKLFPIKRDSPKAPTAILPAKRKQRSLASLVVDTPNVEKKAGLTGKRTKATRPRTPRHATSPDKNETMKVPTKSESQDCKTDKKSSPVATTANKKQGTTGTPKKPLSEDRKNGKTTDKEEIQKPSKTKSPRSSPKNETMKSPTKSESQDHKTEKKSAPQSLKVATTANKNQVTTGINAPKKPLSEDRKNGKTTGKVEIQKPSKTKSPRSSPKTRAVIEEPIKNKEGELPTRKEDTENEAASSGTRVKKSRLGEEKKGSSSEPASSKEKPRIEDNLKQALGSASTNTSHGAVTTPVWLSLVASSNQKEDTKLPQLSKNYLRIKDRCVQVSSVQKYIMTKLDLANEDEVEITCHGEPICSSSTLHGLIDFWVRRENGRHIQASFDAPAKEFVMVLGYRRRRQRAQALLPHPRRASSAPSAGPTAPAQLTETAPTSLLHPRST